MPDRPRRIPEATVARLPVYLRSLLELGGERDATVSSERLAELAGVNAAKVRKDLSYLGQLRHPRRRLRRRVPAVPDEPRARPHPGLAGRHRRRRQPRPGPRQLRRVRRAGLPGRGAVDADRAKVGTEHRRPRRPPRRRPARRRGRGADRHRHHRHAAPRPPRTSPTASSPPASPSILNFAPTVLTVPEGVSLRKVDLAVELQILSFYQQRRESQPSDLAGPADLSPAWPVDGPLVPGEPGARRAAGAWSSAGGRVAARKVAGPGRRRRPGPRRRPRGRPRDRGAGRPARHRHRAARPTSRATSRRLPAGGRRPPTTRRSTARCPTTARRPASGSTPPTTRAAAAFTLPAVVRRGALTRDRSPPAAPARRWPRGCGPGAEHESARNTPSCSIWWPRPGRSSAPPGTFHRGPRLANAARFGNA